jgi:hypothetical protein
MHRQLLTRVTLSIPPYLCIYLLLNVFGVTSQNVCISAKAIYGHRHRALAIVSQWVSLCFLTRDNLTTIKARAKTFGQSHLSIHLLDNFFVNIILPSRHFKRLNVVRLLPFDSLKSLSLIIICPVSLVLLTEGCGKC